MIEWFPVIQAAVGLVTGMLALWVWATLKRNAGWVDVGWALGVGVVTVFYATSGPGDLGRRLLLGVAVGAWALRLGALIFLRMYDSEDPRYASMRKRGGKGAHLLFLVFFLGQALLNVVLTFPAWVLVQPTRGVGAWDFAAAGLIALSVAGSGLADVQLKRWRENPENKGKTCRSGLWRYSRHPNYFFEWLHWCAYPLFGLGALAGLGVWWWATLIGPALMLLFLTKITGIPPAERRALESRGEAYRRYQRETSAFIPWFPKKDV